MSEKKKKTTKSAYYTIEGKTLKKNKKPCPKCGAGVFMAEHKNRYSCGKCSFTEMKGGGKQDN